MIPRVVVVTGVTRHLGAQVAARLVADGRIERVVGIDVATPAGGSVSPPDGVDFHEVDFRGPRLAVLLADVGAEAVAHLGIVTAVDHHGGGRSAMKEINVIGTMQLLAACQQAPNLRKLVVRSSTAAYGVSFRDPAVFTEETEPQEVPRGGFARDVLDIEGYVRGFRRRRPDITATVLRFAPFIGGRAGTRLARYFTLPLVPTVLGRDPRIQFVHVDDALDVLVRSIVDCHPGTYNVAGPGVLTLSQAIHRVGRIPFPVVEPGLSAMAMYARRFGLIDFSLDQLDLFVHGRVVDVSRLEAEFGFRPRSTVDAFDDFARGHGTGLVSPGRVRAAEYGLLAHARRVRASVGGVR